mgnify:CR=1 FL=1
MKRLSVFCASSLGNDTIFQDYAYEVGKTLAKQNIAVVYGGASVGLMGAVADGALENGGEVIGVFPTFMNDKEIAHQELTELIKVETMHERKKIMNDLSDGVMVLPGGFGTLDECFEMLTWGQLGLHQKPVGLLNVNGYFDSLLQFIQHTVDCGLLKESNQKMLLVSDSITDLLQQMKEYKALPVEKWIHPNEI